MTDTETLNVFCGVTGLLIQNCLLLFCEIVRLLALITVSIDILHITHAALWIANLRIKNYKHSFSKWNLFAPGMFFFTVVEPNIGKEEKVGYSVKKETYYLKIGGKIIAKIPLDAPNK